MRKLKVRCLDDFRARKVLMRAPNPSAAAPAGVAAERRPNGMDLEDWRKAISTPTRYRVGGASIHLKPRELIFVLAIVLTVSVLVILVYSGRNATVHPCETPGIVYDATYPLTKPRVRDWGTEYRIAVITDLDTDSKVAETDGKVSWISYYLTGTLTVYVNQSVNVRWDRDKTKLVTKVAEDGRGMELSELIVFNGKLYTVDDRTGIVYHIKSDPSSRTAVPWVIVRDGNGEEVKGFKAEWATVKDQLLYIGGLGKEWTSATGQVENTNPQWVKTVDMRGVVRHIDWRENYNAMRRQAGFEAPGYIIHESAVWSDVHRRWFFLPRRASAEPYDEKADERRAANLLITADAAFGDMQSRRFGPAHATHGFSSFKFVPGTGDSLIVALKSVEDSGQTATYIMTFDLDGRMLLEEKFIDSHKFEGIEFI